MYILYKGHIICDVLLYRDTWYSSYWTASGSPGFEGGKGAQRRRKPCSNLILLQGTPTVFGYSTIELCGEYISYQIRILTCLFCFRHGLEFVCFFFPTHFLHFHSTFSKATSLPNTMSFLSYSAMLSFSSESQAGRIGNVGWNEYRCQPKNRGTPKSSILIRFSMIFTIHFGVPIFLETPM